MLPPMVQISKAAKINNQKYYTTGEEKKQVVYFTDDPASDFSYYDQEQARRLAHRPVCLKCGEHIQEEHYFYIDGRIWCQDCMENEFRRVVEVDFYA